MDVNITQTDRGRISFILNKLQGIKLTIDGDIL